MAGQTIGEYVQMFSPQGYVHSREITNMGGLWLVQGSRDCVIVNKEKVVSRKGYTLLGSVKTKNKGHRSSIDWETSTNVSRSLKMNDAGELSVYYAGDWRLLHTYTAKKRANFTSWWDATTEKIDMLLFVVQDATVQMWSGGAAKIGSYTATTLTIQGYMNATTISFVDNGAADDTLLDSALGFLDAGFSVGDEITVTGSTSNNSTYTVKTVTAGTITLSSEDNLTTEASGDSVTITRPGATWAAQRFLTAGTRKVLINGVEYAYTGGESTATLTGLTGLAGVTAGDVALQAVRSSSPASLAGMTLSLIETWNNYVFYGDSKDRTVYMSKSSDYADFAYTSPLRVPGEGMKFSFDSSPTAFVPSAVEDEFYVCGRKNDWYKVTSILSSEQGSEEMRIKKMPTATGQAAQSQSSVIHIKNGVAFLSFEPSIDTLTRLLSINTPTSQALSRDIADDLLGWDRTDAHGIFYQDQMFICYPNEGIVHIYDFANQHWQPPHHLPIGRLALIDILDNGIQVLCGHSSVSDETYVLYDGYTDNNAPLSVAMAFNYDNNGLRFSKKTSGEYPVELYMSDNTKVTHTVLYEYQGSEDIRSFIIDGSEDFGRFTPKKAGGLGFAKLGNNPLGSLASPVDDLSKFRVTDTTSEVSVFEKQHVFTSEGKDIRFALIAHGSNDTLSTDIASEIKR